MTSPQVGHAIRAQRRDAGLTLAGLARQSGLSAPFLSQVENDRARPSMASLQRIADALGTTAALLLSGAEEAGRVDVVRAAETTPLPPTEQSSRESVRPLVRGPRQLHALEFTGGEHGDREFVHRNDELMYVVRGSARVVAHGAEQVLHEGDALYCAGGVPHSWQPLSDDTRVLLVAVSDKARVTLTP